MRTRLRRPAPAPEPEADDARRAVWTERCLELARVLGVPAPGPVGSSAELSDALRRTVDLTDRAQVWLALAVLTAQLPDEASVVEVARGCEFRGAGPLVAEIERRTSPEGLGRRVRVGQGVLVDVAHTVSTPLMTGIQRVARETARRWLARPDVVPVSWTPGFTAIRELTPAEHGLLVSGRASASELAPRPDDVLTVVVPWRATYLVPELGAEPGRTAALLALARFSGNRTGAIGFDLVPITTAETTQRGFAAVFARNLAAVRYFDRVAAISQAACTEYEGWRHMLAAVGVAGPAIRSVPLPVHAARPTPEDMAGARERFVVGDLPTVLVVGSHEPRKNHLAVLHAAELLWREGLRFSLSFVGGNAWGSDAFQAQLAALVRAGRPVDSQRGLSDGELWAAYRLARFTVFPSLNEGFGLPVAESLAAGTPVVTSDFGSMAELAADGGALTVDPRDDHAVADAMRRLLTDDRLLEDLRRDAEARPGRDWDQYADEAWSWLAGTARPEETGAPR
ncbi:glycosyltransferase family 1 protein [Cellulomonas sp. GbtcB1]|uniref:glycosyltransferase family 4 protein n=1 Tax=Cellulomonas sp. GbtcB1 TaxID=2824746 RepID=UPI001C307911|nr:glycosyltransferase family 1 protein [Cellulomonas sp. GbtcB1]